MTGLRGAAIRGLALVGITSQEAMAGMPSLSLTDVTWLRFEAISFFGMLLLAATWGLRAIWNGLRGDFPWLPRLSFGRALGLVAIWGLLFLLVLTMISGARELMTPGAWRKVGLTYKLADEAQPIRPVDATEPARRVALEKLWALLQQYAANHAGQLPTSREASGLPDAIWLVPGPAPLHYVYIGNHRVAADPVPIAYEPGLFGPERLVLLSNGGILKLTLAAIENAATPPGAPKP